MRVPGSKCLLFFSISLLFLLLLLLQVVEAQQEVAAIVWASVSDVGMKLENVRAVPSEVEAGKTLSFYCDVTNLSTSYFLNIRETSRFEIYAGVTLIENLLLGTPLQNIAPGGTVSITKSWSTVGKAPGNYRFVAVIEGESAGYSLTVRAENTFTILAAADFYLSLNPPSAQVTVGGTVSSTVYVRAIGTFTETVSLTLSDVPAGVSGTLSPTSGTPPFSSTLSLSVSSTASPGTYYIVVRGTTATKIRENTFTLTILAPENVPPPENVPRENLLFPVENVPRKATQMLLFLHPLLLEAVPGVPYSLRFGLHNPDNIGIENVFLSQEGIDNATLVPARLSLPALSKAPFHPQLHPSPRNPRRNEDRHRFRLRTLREPSGQPLLLS